MNAMCFCAQVGLGTKFRSSLSSVWSHLRAIPAAILTSAPLLMKQIFLNKFRSCIKWKTAVLWRKWDFKDCLEKTQRITHKNIIFVIYYKSNIGLIWLYKWHQGWLCNRLKEGRHKNVWKLDAKSHNRPDS